MTLQKSINDKVYRVVGSCMEVHKTLGPGYPVDFYKNALEVELPTRNLEFKRDEKLDIMFKDTLVGQYDVDFIVDGKVILLVKVEDSIQDREIQQVLRCLAITDCVIGVLVNFGGTKIQYKRVMPNYKPRDNRKDKYRGTQYREMGRTRESNPIV